MDHFAFGTGKLRKFIQHVSPFLGDDYSVVLLLLGVDFEPGIFAGPDQLLEVLGMHSRKDGEEIFA